MTLNDKKRILNLLKLSAELIQQHWGEIEYEEILPDVVTSLLFLVVEHLKKEEEPDQNIIR